MSQSVPDDLLTAPVSAAFFDRGYLWHFRARSHRVIDGDTFVALVDCGFRVAAMPHIRVRDVFAPERTEPGHDLARLALQNALIPERFFEWPLRIISLQRETVISEVQSFERFVADVFVVQADGGLIDVKDLL